MQVVLLERMDKLGQMGDVVTVKDGYARNYLVPQGKALRATKSNLADFERRRVQLEAVDLERKTEARKLAGQIDRRSVVIIRQAGEGGQLYGSVNPRDVAAAFTEDGVTMERNQVQLPAALKTLGIHQVRVRLHPEVDVFVTVNVARSPEEAEIQADPGRAAATPDAGEEDAQPMLSEAPLEFGDEVTTDA
jgi:large subunit ribosomal protein L9